MISQINIFFSSEIVLTGLHEFSIKNNILTVQDSRVHYWKYSGMVLKVVIGDGEEKTIRYGTYIDGRTDGIESNFQLI
jgi:hypothetical protein